MYETTAPRAMGRRRIPQRYRRLLTQAGGGVVVIPPGRYISGTIHLKSNATLYISPGATLAESPDNSDFDPYETLTFRSVSDVRRRIFIMRSSLRRTSTTSP
jgi:polygalacturonase